MTQLKQPPAPAGTATLNFHQLGESIRASYRHVAEKYRQDDEIEINTEHHRHLRRVLHMVSLSFGRPINVLDVGCGTGRYFYCLKNARRLVGIDVSEEMLKVAEAPVRQSEITAGEIELRQENAHLCSFPPGSFDLIYSLGMFGNGCPVTQELCHKFHDWLTPGGQLFFDVAHISIMPLWRRTLRGTRETLYPWLPPGLRRALDTRGQGIRFCGMSRRQLSRVISRTPFTNVSILSRVCHSPLWQGKHLECAATKGEVQGRKVRLL